MAETKFTPGPWAHFDSSAARDIFNGCSVIVSHHIDDAIIATIGEDVPNHEGNARLIAAAPEMYEALAKMVSDDAFAELCAGIGEEPEWLNMARAAHAKAVPHA